MGKLGLDFAGRLPALELITPSKPVRELITPGEPFDSHLKRAEIPPTNKEVASPAKSSSGSEASLADSAPNKTTTDESSAPKKSESSTNNSETETNDTGSPESQVTNTESEASVAANAGEQDSEEHESDTDEVTLSDNAIQVAQDKPNTAVLESDLTVTEPEEGEQSESSAIDTDEAPDQDGKKNAQENLAARKSIEPAQETPKNKLVLEGESAKPTIEEPQPTITETTEISSEQNHIESEEVYHAAKRPPLVFTEANATESTEKAENITKNEQGQQDETTDEAKIVVRKLNSESEEGVSKEESSQEKKVSRKSKAEPNRQVTRVQESSPDKATPVEDSQPSEIQRVGHVEAEPKSPELRSQTSSPTPISSNPSEVTSISDAKPPAENNSAVRASSSIREASFGRAAKAQGQTSGTDVTPSIDRAKFVQRVSRALHISHERGGEIRLRLSPPELGSLMVEIQLKDGVLTAQLEAETPAAQKLLLENVSVLKDRLAEQQVRVERFDVELADRSPQNPQDGQQRGSAEQRQARGPLRNGLSSESPDAEQTASNTDPSIQADTGQLNVII